MYEEPKKSLDIKEVLKSASLLNSSDLHLVPNTKPQIRINKVLTQMDLPILSAKEIEKIAYELLEDRQKRIFEENHELDFSFEIAEVGRFRANYYKTISGIACAFRIITLEVPPLEKFGNNPILKDLIKREKGLILVTGATGSGKSTTLASMLHEINLTAHKHIITIEDPVEFVHKNINSLFSQREIGSNTNSFATALKSALREDPDVILVGEMRDKETISAAITAAETGHIVFGTLHTNSAPSTINRIINVFDPAEKTEIKMQLASSLIAVISQSLIPKLDGGLVSTQEILIVNSAIENLIREDKIHQIYSQMQLNQNETNMTTQTQQLLDLFRKNIISKESALSSSNRVQELIKILD